MVFGAEQVEEWQIGDEEETCTVGEDEDGDVELEGTVEEGVEGVEAEET